jgi:hypothetical protein
MSNKTLPNGTVNGFTNGTSHMEEEVNGANGHGSEVEENGFHTHGKDRAVRGTKGGLNRHWIQRIQQYTSPH